MRPLSDEETKVVFDILYKYVGGKLKFLVEREDKKYLVCEGKNLSSLSVSLCFLFNYEEEEG